MMSGEALMVASGTSHTLLPVSVEDPEASVGQGLDWIRPCCKEWCLCLFLKELEHLPVVACVVLHAFMSRVLVFLRLCVPTHS